MRRLPRVVFWDNLPAPYGVERYNLLADRGTLDFSVWFSRRTDPDRSWHVDESTWRFNGSYVEDPGRSLGSLSRFVRRCDAVRPDLVVSLYGERAFVVGHLVLKALGYRTAFVVERTFDTWVRRRWWKEALKAVLFRSADAAQVHAPPACVRGADVTDGFVYAFRYGFPRERAFGVTHSFDLHRYGVAISPDTRELVRRRLGVAGCVFLYVGRFWAGKGLPVLVEAYRRTRLRRQDISLVLVGEGADEAALRRAAAGLEGLVFVPAVQPSDLPAYYGASDVFVFPTLGDPFGLVVEEAHAAGLPVITSDAAGDVQWRVTDGRTGFMVPAGDASALSGKMLALANDPELRRIMGTRGAERVKVWGHGAWADDFERFVDEALAQNPRMTVSGTVVRAAGAALVAAADVEARFKVWHHQACTHGVLATVRRTVAARANKLGLLLVSLPWRLRRPRTPLSKFGTDYHGWVLPARALRAGGVCYSIGVGEDTSLEEDLLRKTDCHVWSFDPTPRAIAHVATRTFDAARFLFVPVAVWDAPGHIDLFEHPDPGCDTYSPVNLWRTQTCLRAACTTVAALMQQFGHASLLLLKINIGGGEWRVLENVLAAAPHVEILCVEFCQPASFWRIAAMVARLRRAGYAYCCHERWKFTFMRSDPQEATAAASRDESVLQSRAGRRQEMTNLVKALVGLAALAFVAAIVTNFTGELLTTAEGWSRAATNLALLAIALVWGFGSGRPASMP